jgi:hypothetical protein
VKVAGARVGVRGEEATGAGVKEVAETGAERAAEMEAVATGVEATEVAREAGRAEVAKEVAKEVAMAVARAAAAEVEAAQEAARVAAAKEVVAEAETMAVLAEDRQGLRQGRRCALEASGRVLRTLPAGCSPCRSSRYAAQSRALPAGPRRPRPRARRQKPQTVGAVWRGWPAGSERGGPLAR